MKIASISMLLNFPRFEKKMIETPPAQRNYDHNPNKTGQFIGGAAGEGLRRFGTNFQAHTCFPLMVNFALSIPLRITSMTEAE